MSEARANGWEQALNGTFPLWIKIPYTVFVGLLIPVYWQKVGPTNFLWFSDIALFALVIALWFESRLLTSMMAVAVLFPEIVWNIGFFARLLLGIDILGIAGYMFDPEKPLIVRGLSLFHAVLPPLLLWMLYRLGYDRRALVAQTVVTWIVLPATYMLATPDTNVNWVFGIGESAPQTWMPGWLWVVLLMAFVPALMLRPTHRFLLQLFKQRVY